MPTRHVRHALAHHGPGRVPSPYHREKLTTSSLALSRSLVPPFPAAAAPDLRTPPRCVRLKNIRRSGPGPKGLELAASDRLPATNAFRPRARFRPRSRYCHRIGGAPRQRVHRATATEKTSWPRRVCAPICFPREPCLFWVGIRRAVPLIASQTPNPPQIPADPNGSTDLTRPSLSEDGQGALETHRDIRRASYHGSFRRL